MTKNEYDNLKVGDWVLFDELTQFNMGMNCEVLLDGKPHQIIKAGHYDLSYYRLGFDGVKCDQFIFGWCYHNWYHHMTKVNSPTPSDPEYIFLDIQKEVDIVIPRGDI